MADDTVKPDEYSDINDRLFGKDPCERTIGFELSVERYGRLVKGFVGYLAEQYGRWLDPEDAVQDTFLGFFQMVNNGGYTPQHTVNVVLISIARKRVADFGRKRCVEQKHIDWGVRVEEVELPNAEPSPLDKLERPETLKWLEGLRPAVLDGLDTLASKEWEVYTAWLDLLKKPRTTPTLDKLVEQLYGRPPTEKARKRLKDKVRKTRDRAQAKLCKYLAIRGYRP